jgi:hypothetical protein
MLGVLFGLRAAVGVGRLVLVMVAMALRRWMRSSWAGGARAAFGLMAARCKTACSAS